MSTLPTLAVTGSTGALGGLVAQQVAALGLAQRLLVRTPSRAPRLAGATAVRAEHGDRESSLRALEGVSTLFLVSGSESADRLEQHRTVVDAAAEAGVEHVVYTSFYGAAPDATFTLARDHHATEGFLRDSGMRHTFLRDNLYLDVLPDLAGRDGVIRGPAGQGRVAAVARADIARVAVTVLEDPAAHRDITYELTGPEALSLEEVAALVSRARGREVSYHDETLEEAYESRRPWGVPQWQADAWVSTYTAIAAGELAGVTGHVAALTGREPQSLADHLAATAD